MKYVLCVLCDQNRSYHFLRLQQKKRDPHFCYLIIGRLITFKGRIALVDRK